MLHQFGAARDRVGIAVDAEHAAIGGLEHGARVAAAAERAIDIVLAVLGRKHLQHFGEHHWNVAAHAPPSISLSRCALRRAMLCASAAAKASASQIWNFCDRPTKAMRSFKPAWAIMASGRRTRPPSSNGKSCVRPTMARAVSSWAGDRKGSS